MVRSEEILAVKELGDKIGYGNMMDIASALWANMLEDSYGISSGAFVPTVLPLLKKKERSRVEERQKLVQSEVRESFKRGFL